MRWLVITKGEKFKRASPFFFVIAFDSFHFALRYCHPIELEHV